MSKTLVFFLCSAVFFVFASPLFAKQTSSHRAYYVPGEILVKFKETTQIFPLAEMNVHTLAGAKLVKKYHIPQGLELVKIAKADVQEALNTYRSQDTVEYAEPNFIYTIDAKRQEIEKPNDPLFDQQWDMINTGQKDSGGQEGVEDSDIDAPEAWVVTQGNKDVVVAVIDTGIDYTHEDLQGAVWSNPGEIPDNEIDDDNNGFIDDIHGWDFANNDKDPMDDHSHGTHVSGTIAAQNNNGIGVSGIAPNVSLMGVKFLDSQGSGTLDNAVSAINYSVKMGAKVLSNSWGGGGYSQSLYDVIEQASQKNVLFVAAAGNDSQNNDVTETYPAGYKIPNVLAVAATDNKDALASFSNYGANTVQVSAPGDKILSTVAGNKYASYSGTSMATPHVSAVSALVLSVEPNLTAEEVIMRLVDTSDEVLSIRRKVKSMGRVNAYNAVNNIIPPKKSPKDPGGWVNTVKKISTPHNYKPNSKESWTVTHKGANYIKIHFAKLDTEEGYDQVKVLDKDGNVIDQVDGKMNDFWCFIVRGDTATITFESDDNVNKYGFDIDKFAYSKADKKTD